MIEIRVFYESIFLLVAVVDFVWLIRVFDVTVCSSWANVGKVSFCGENVEHGINAIRIIVSIQAFSCSWMNVK